MNDEDSLWRRLLGEGIISEVPLRLGGGNADRDPARARSSWRARLVDGADAKLTVAADLAEYARRTDAFGQLMTGFAPSVIFHQRDGAIEVVAETFMSGRSLEELLQTEPRRAEEAAPAIARLASRIAALTRPSKDEAREAEWLEWTRALLSLPCWEAAGREFLAGTLLPLLKTRLFAGTPAKQWVHGDFIARNIVIDDVGEARLIDAEFAVETHFPGADRARFHALSPGVDQLATRLGPAIPKADDDAELLFWLQQVERETKFNRSEYQERWLPVRLAEIRRVGEVLAGGPLPDCPWRAGEPRSKPVAPLTIDFCLEEAHWLVDSPTHALRLAGWCFPLGPGEELKTVEAGAGREQEQDGWRTETIDGAQGRAAPRDGGRGNEAPRTKRRAPSAKRETRVASGGMRERRDVQAHFGGDPRALRTGFELLLPPVDPFDKIELVAVLASGERRPFWSGIAGDLPGRGPVLCSYSEWAHLLDPDPPADRTVDLSLKFSILLPVHETPLPFLRASLDSVRRQYYSHWELCVVNDGSVNPEVGAVLQEFATADSRIHVTSHPVNGGIARATNAALERATGDFIVMLDHDDVLRPHALAELADRLRHEPDLDALYSDEDKIDADGHRTVPMFKPGFSPEHLRGVMYLGHVLCVRRSIAEAVGGFDPAFDGVQDYEFMLRVSEKTSRIGHIPRVLYHWRQSAGSSALVGNVKGDMDQKQVTAVQAHLRRSGDARVAESLGGHRVRLAAGGGPGCARGHGAASGERVPGDGAEIPNDKLQTSKSGAGTEPAPKGFFRVVYRTDDVPLAALVRALGEAKTDVLLLVSEQVSGLTQTMANELATVARLADSGGVSPVLLSPNGTVLESGCTTVNGYLAPIMLGFDGNGDGFNGSLRCNREVLAVSSWCVAVRSDVAVLHASAATSWIDFCARLRSAGLYHRVCAGVRVTLPFGWKEYPGAGEEPVDGGRSTLDVAQGRAAAPVRPAEIDPFYNPHFEAESADYRLARRPVHLPRAAQPFVFNLESTVPERLAEGWLALRGWCFHLEGNPVLIRVSGAGFRWETPSREFRPDVASAYAGLTDGLCGFEIRLGLPAGGHGLKIEARTDSKEQTTLLDQPVSVSRGLLLRRWASAAPATRIAFQLMAAASHPPIERVAEEFPRPSSRGARRPNFAIVTPSFQQAAHLRETLSSVLDQDIACEYVVQDGGSTDGTVGILREQSSRLTAWASERDAGQADAIAKGFRRTAGHPEDVMAWINSDDFYLPGTLAYVADYFARHPEVDVVYGHRILVDADSQEIGRWFLPPHDDEVLRLNDFVPQETLFWRRRIWDRVGGIDVSYKFAMDWDLLLRFQAAGAKIIRVPYFLACFRIHPAQKTAAQMEAVGQKEIDSLRRRTFGHPLSPAELADNARLIRYLRKSAWIEFLWRCLGIRSR